MPEVVRQISIRRAARALEQICAAASAIFRMGSVGRRSVQMTPENRDRATLDIRELFYVVLSTLGRALKRIARLAPEALLVMHRGWRCQRLHEQGP
jgi:hypothetical protein